jgi:type II secretory pathway pseudopilin PulG
LNLGPEDYTHLAVTQDLGLYRAMTRAEFNTCRRVGEFYLCDRGLVLTKAPKLDLPPPPWKDPALCLFALFVRRFELLRETCRTTIGGTESAMRMVSPNSFGSYNNKAHRGLVTCSGKDTGGPESKSFTASGLTKITLPHGCTAETDTHIFAAADDGFSRSENEYTVSYMWPFDPSTLTPGLDTKKFSDIIRRNLTRLANNTRHNIPLEVALQGVGDEYGVPLNMNEVLDKHHYVTVPIITVIIVIILTIAVIFRVVIVRSIAKSKRQDQLMAHMGEQQDILFEALRNREEEEGRERRRPRKPTAPQPPQPETYRQPGPPSYAAAGRGHPGYAVTPQSPDGRPGYSLGATQSLIVGLQEHEASTAGHSLGMNIAGLQGEAAEMLGGFRIGRDQVATKNFPRGAPVAINMEDMMERR